MLMWSTWNGFIWIQRRMLGVHAIFSPELILVTRLSSLKETWENLTQTDGEKGIENAFKKLKCFFSGKRFQDTPWSRVVCISAAVSDAISLSFTLSFGVLFPELMRHLNATRERTDILMINLFQWRKVINWTLILSLNSHRNAGLGLRVHYETTM